MALCILGFPNRVATLAFETLALHLQLALHLHLAFSEYCTIL